MTIQEMRERKKEYGYTNEQIAALSEVPLGTVQKIFGGKTDTPRYETRMKLETFFLREQDHAKSQAESLFRYEHRPGVVKEAAPAYGTKKQGEYTLEDYYALPDDHRAELIDGVLYDMSSPSGPHQAIIAQLHFIFEQFVRSHKGPCRVILSPYDVQLDMDNRTMVEPDLLVICKQDKIRVRCCFGAPDLAIEVLSPSTRRKDIHIKTAKYQNAGVREYWMIDPDTRQVLVYDFTKDVFPTLYGFDAKVPVSIWDGALEVDFAEISREIQYIYDNEARAADADDTEK